MAHLSKCRWDLNLNRKKKKKKSSSVQSQTTISKKCLGSELLLVSGASLSAF